MGTPQVIDMTTGSTTNRREMLEMVWGRGKGKYVCIAHFEIKTRKMRHEYFDRTKLDWPEIERRISYFVGIGHQVYFSAATLHIPNIKGENVASTRIIFVDCDSREESTRLRRFKLRPTFLIQTSPGKHQAIWVVNDPLDNEGMHLLTKKLNRALIADKGVHEPNRLLRMPGTPNVKYEAAPYAEIVDVGRRTSISELEAYIPDGEAQLNAPEGEPPVKLRHWLGKLAKRHPKLHQLARGYDEHNKPIEKGGRSEQFNFLGRSLAELEWSTPVTRAILEYANKRLMGGRYSDAQIEQQLAKFEEAARQERMARLTMDTLNRVTRRTHSWVWEGNIPQGDITVLEGDGDVGKSTVMMDIIARFSSGQSMPFAKKPLMPASNVLILAPEEDAEKSTIGKVEEAGGDPSKIIVLKGFKDEKGWTQMIELPRDTSILEEIVIHRDIKMIYIEPLSAFMGEGIRPDEQGFRKMLTPLQELARRHDVAIITLRHWNKSQEITSLAGKGLGSVAVRNVARSVFSFFPSPEDSKLRIMALTKSNLRRRETESGQYEAMTYRIESSENDREVPVIHWTEVLQVDNLDALFKSKGSTSKTSKVEDCAADITAVLTSREGDGMLIRELDAYLQGKDHTAITIRRAKKSLTEAGEISIEQAERNIWVAKIIDGEELEES